MKKYLSIVFLSIIISSCTNDDTAIYLDSISQFHESISKIELYNKRIYTNMDEAMFYDRALFEPYYNKFLKVKKCKKRIFYLLDSLQTNKCNIPTDSVIGKSLSKKDLLKRTSLNSNEVALIINSVNNYKDTCLSVIDVKDTSWCSVSITEIKKTLDVRKLPEINTFNTISVTVIELMACFEKLKYDISIIESNMLTYIHNYIGVDDLIFSNLEAFVIPNSNILPIGFPYKAEIFWAAYDSTVSFNYEIDGNEYKTDSNPANYKAKVTKKSGKVSKLCFVLIKAPRKGKIQKIPFKIEYEVLEKK